MKFSIILQTNQRGTVLPINYQYPLSAAVYKIMEKGDAAYSAFLHEKGYGKGYKFFTFSDLDCRPYKREGDRLQLLNNEARLMVSFHLPEASQHFIKGLFMSQQLTIADQRSRIGFNVKSVETLPNPLALYEANEVMPVHLKPLSPIVTGVKNENGKYDFLSPEDSRFTESLLYNWREKIKANYDEETAKSAVLNLEVKRFKNSPKSRLVWIKAGTQQQTKIRGYTNFELEALAERRFLEVLMNCGTGLYNAMGMGCVGLLNDKKKV